MTVRQIILLIFVDSTFLKILVLVILKKKMDELLSLDGFDNSYRFVSGKLVYRNMLENIAFNVATPYGEDMEFWFKIYMVSD